MARTTPSKKSNNAKHTPNFLEGEFNLPKLEEKVLAFWDRDDIFQKSIAENRAGKKTKQFVFYEGPPYANGKPAIHHVLARVIKDVILRYKTMQGYYVPRRAGWDTHGLPVEMAAEKELGFRSKKDIEQYGVKKFNEKAKEQVWLHKDEWERMTRRIGYWVDLKNAYVTYSPEYIETIWWTMARIAARDLLYKGHKVVPWCTRCGTALSSHELAQGYKETTDNSVYVKFKLKPGQKIGAHLIKPDDKIYILSWTTTPWTLPGNVALAVGPKIKYAAVEHEGEYLIAAVDRLEELGLEEGDRMHELSGADLVGLEYEPLFDVKPLMSPRSYKVYPADFVTTTDGTGVVHTAVMYGEDDYALGKKIGLPEHHTVDEEGKFKNIVPELVGKYAKGKETEEKIFELLKERGNLWRTKTYVHEYPYCWRCGTAILYYARTSWFIAMSKLRTELLKNNATVNWMPEHVKAGRFGEWLREVKDWNLSRERYWGAPLPIWECKQCGHTEVVESLDALSALAAPAKNNYWAMRHGEAENNVKHVADSGTMNFHLTAKGKKQVEASVKKLKKIDLVFSSDLLRTKETAAIAAAALGAKVIFDARLREMHSGARYDGRPIGEYLSNFSTQESRFEKRPEGGESLRDVRARVWNFLKECEEKYAGKNILMVSHGDPIWMLLQAAHGFSEKREIEPKQGDHGYPKTGEVIAFVPKAIPRNDTGEVDLHRPFVDEVTLVCPKCKKDMKRVREVADVWYDSGAMPFAQAHYPFDEAKTNIKTLSGLAFPANYIAEGMDQTRGWFYTLMAISTALGYEAPYKNVVALGLINDKFGQKMSKSKGNVVEPFAIIDQYGVDALRWYFYTGSPLGEPKNFDDAEIAKAFRRTHLIIYNSFVFWKTYADQNAVLKGGAPKNILDAWILARLNEVIDSVSKKLDVYEIRGAAIEIETFVDDLSRWYIRRSRRRLQRPESAADYAAASATLGYALRMLVTMMAPFTPFFSEGLYAALHGSQESVHLDAWPEVDKKSINKKTIVSMKLAREFAAAGLALRAKEGIKVRQPLASMKVGAAIGKEFEKIVADEVNVKKVIVDKTLGGAPENMVLDTVVTAALRDEGSLRDIVRMFQELRQKAELSPRDKIVAMLMAPDGLKNVVMKNEAVFKSEVGATRIAYGEPKKFIAEQSAKIDEQEIRVAIREA